MSLLRSARKAVDQGKSGFGLSSKLGSGIKKITRDPTSFLPGTNRGYIGDAWRGIEKGVSGFFKPDMPDIPVPPTMGAPIQHSSRPTVTASDALFGRGTGHRAVRTRGPTALTRRRS